MGLSPKVTQAGSLLLGLGTLGEAHMPPSPFPKKGDSIPFFVNVPSQGSADTKTGLTFVRA